MKYWKTGLAVGLLFVFIGLLIFAAVRWRDFPGLAPSPVEPPEAQLERAHAALVATENLETSRAELHWSALHAQMPDDASVALNRALNRVLHVDTLIEATQNTGLPPAERESHRRRLPPAIEQARQAVDEFFRASEDPLFRLWLDSRIDMQAATLLPEAAGRSLHEEVFTRLSSAILQDLQEDPRSIVLGGILLDVVDELESPTDGVPEEILRAAADSTEELWRQHPDNLFLALRASQLNIAAASEDAIAPLRKTRELTGAINPSLAASTQAIGLTPDELVENVVEAVRQQNWPTAEKQMRLWFNVLNNTDLVRTDRRRASPHPLDRLSFEIHRRLASEVAPIDPIVAGGATLQFSATANATANDAANGAANDAVWADAVDMNLDLTPEIIAASADGTVSLSRQSSESAWERIDELQIEIPSSGFLSADLFMVDASDPDRIQLVPGRDGGGSAPPPERHTTMPTLIVYGEEGVRLVSIDGRAATADSERLSLVTEETGLEDVFAVRTAIAGDLEGDGDLDLVFATGDRGLRIFINRGNRTFFELDLATQDQTLSTLDSIADMGIVDIDRDLDLDIVTADSESGRVGILENLLHLQFRHRELSEVPAVQGANQIQIEDLDGNVSWDIVIGGPGQAQAVYSHTPEAGAWVVEQVESISGASSHFLLADFDNDGWHELISQSSDGVTVTRLAGPHRDLEPVSADGLLGQFTSGVDFNRDGRLDVLSMTDGQWSISRNTTEPAGHYMSVRIRGIADNNANSGRVNHYAIGSILELRFGPHYRAAVVTSPTTHFGLDGFAAAGSLRVIFPNGLTQVISDPEVDALVEEQQTLKGSCPYLYSWDGEKFAFVTDCLWAAPLGLQVSAGVVAKDRPWEYLKIDGDHVRARDGRYELGITEELWEVAYIDHVSLMAVDHPSDVEIWTNEKVGPAAIAKRKIHVFGSADRLPLQTAADTYGRDVTADLRSIDQTYVQGFDRRIRQGLCPPHWVDVDFGDLPPAAGEAPIFLVLTGWILPTDTSLNIQIDQNPELPPVEYPSLWVPDSTAPDGWRQSVAFIGFPGGKTKTMVVDVSSVLDRNDPRLRVRTSAQIYWDAAQLAIQTEVPEIVTHELSLSAAELQYHGFSAQISASSKSPHTYHYANASEAPKWPPLRGRFTAFGPCEPLLDQWDDSMVVMGSGDELRLQFTVPDKEIPEGWKRDFILHCVGWDKDADLNTLAGQTSEPLPFRKMQAYPPTQSQADESMEVTRRNSGHLKRTQNFRDFWQR